MADQTPDASPDPEKKPSRAPRHSRHRSRNRHFRPRTEGTNEGQPPVEDVAGEHNEDTPAEKEQPGTQSERSDQTGTHGRQPGGRQQPRAQQHGMDLSIVIPLYNEEGSLKELHKEIRSTVGRMGMRHEIIFVDDGSTDSSFQVLRDIKRFDHRIKIIRFRRNYGKSAALSVGFAHAQGNIVVTMDADLQDDPGEIPALVKKMNEGFDLISGWKRVRRDPLSKTIPSRFFNTVTSLLTGIRLHDFNCGLKAYRKDVVKTVKVYGELHRYVPVLAHGEGFRVGEIAVHHRARKYGKTKFGIGRFWKGFLDLVTVLFTTRYFRNPLHLFGFWGVIAMLAGIGIDAWLAVEWLLGQTALSNRPLFLVGILLIIVGIQMVSIGLLGEMITKSRQEEQEYIIRDFIR